MQSFLESGLKPEILRALDDLGFDTPTPIQAEILTDLESGYADLVALAQTGTGKTAGFGLPLIHETDPKNKNIQSLILCPTRELCMQITEDLKSFARYIDGLFITPVYGGAPMSQQAKFLTKGSQIVVGTPGRVLDMIGRGILRPDRVERLVLDEADEMLNMGFKDELEAILQNLPESRTTWLFSATMPPKVEGLARRYMGEAKRISIGKRNEGAKNVTHEYCVVKASDRLEALKRFIDSLPDFYGVVFCRTRAETNELAQKLSKHGYPAQALNGDLSQAQRDSVMRNFRSRSLRLLVATDVAARGIDVDDLTHVVNYNLPDDPEVYVHRSGRTGRAGKMGICLSILHSREQYKLKDIQRMVGKKFELVKVPTGDEIVRGRVLRVAEDIHYANADHPQFENLAAEMDVMLLDLDRQQLIAQLARWALGSFKLEETGKGDINVSWKTERREDRDRKSKRDKPKKERSREGVTERGFTTLELNVGARQNIKPNRLMGVINEMMGTDKVNFGRIEIDYNRSTIDVEEKFAHEVAMSISGLNIAGRSLEVVVTDAPLQKRKKTSSSRGKFAKSAKNKKRRGYDSRK
jgi:ATP-dependent RNA helicase DeaD